MKKMIMTAIAAALVLLTGAAAAQGPLAETYTAHGGLDTWRGLEQYTFVLEVDPPGEGDVVRETHQVDLRQRSARIDGEDYTILYDGENATVEPGPEAYQGSADFWALTPFYFLAMPFVFADPGVNVTPAEPVTVDGKPYDVFNVDFDQGVGESPDDIYVLMVDPETRKLAWVQYTVTHPDVMTADTPEQAERHWLKITNTYRTAGLELPREFIIYKPDDAGRPGDEYATFRVLQGNME